MISIDSLQNIILQLTRQVRLEACKTDAKVSRENDRQGLAARYKCGR